MFGLLFTARSLTRGRRVRPGSNLLLWPFLTVLFNLLICYSVHPAPLLFLRGNGRHLETKQEPVLDDQIPYLTTMCEQITFITIPRPQKRERDILMSIRVLAAWLSFPFARVILAINENSYDPQNRVLPMVARVFGRSRLRFTGDLPTGYDNRPLIREWFKMGTREVRDGYLCFLNGDIIPSYQWLHVSMRVFRTLNKRNRTVIYGTRTHISEKKELWKLNISDVNYRQQLERYCTDNVKWHNPNGMDLFLIHATMSVLNWDDFPDFVVGMCVWDNFFQGWANTRCDTVTLNFDPMLFHVEHQQNACNSTNFKIFRIIARCGEVVAPLHLYHDAKWHLHLRKNQLKSTATGEILELEK